MKKIFKHIRIFFTYLFVVNKMRNYPTNNRISNNINRLLDSGIKMMSTRPYEMYIMFNNDIILTGWCENKYYAWLRCGEMLTPTEGVFFQWNSEMPSRYIIAKLLVEIKDYKKITPKFRGYF